MSDIDVERLQASLNRFTNRWLENVAPLIVDGEKGFLANRRIMTVKWYLGYLGERDGKVTSRFVRRMRHPRDPRWSSVRQVLRGIRRRRRQRRRAIEDLDPRPGVSRFDGRPVATWLRTYLVWAREHGWRGQLISGALTRAQRAAVLRDLRPADLSGPLRRARLEPLEKAEAARGGRRVGLHPVRGAHEARSVPASNLQRARPNRSGPFLIQREVTWGANPAC